MQRVIGLFGALALFCGHAVPASAQSLYQSVEFREVCTPDGTNASVLTAVDGSVQWELPSGTEVRVSDFTFGPNADGYFRISYAVGTQDEQSSGYILADDVQHFCDYADRQEEPTYQFRALPNTCHLIGASRETVAEVNAFVAEHQAFFPTMGVYLSDNGWYAISLGLIDVRAMPLIARASNNIPQDAYCSTGDTYVSALEKRATDFAVAERPVFATARERRDTARDLLVAARETNDGDSFKKACDLGDVYACGYYATYLKDAGLAKSVRTILINHYDLLGCMRGDPVGCNNAYTFDDGYVDRTLGYAVPYESQRFWPSKVSLELAKVACDAGVAPSCFHLGYATWGQRRTYDTTWPTAAHAIFESCAPGRDWRCRSLREVMDIKYGDLGIGLTQFDENAIFLKTNGTLPPEVTDPTPAPGTEYATHAQQCRIGIDSAAQTACSTAFNTYVMQVSATNIDPLLDMLESNCTAERPVGCARLAFAYGPNKMSGADGLIFQGLDQPRKRLSALQRGCADQLLRENTCATLGRVLAESGDIDAAHESYKRACGYVLALPIDEIFYEQISKCYDAGKHALYIAQDYATASHYFGFVCDTNDIGTSPYACKHLGHIAENGLDAPVDLPKAAWLYRRACFHHIVATTDGEGCLRFGRMMLAHQTALIDSRADVLFFSQTAPIDDGLDQQAFAEDVSRAFQRGCADDIPQACAANDDLFEQRAAGSYGADATTCLVKDSAGAVVSRKSCDTFRHYSNAPAFQDTSNNDFIDRVFLWPDGDRTIVSSKAGRWALNGQGVTSAIKDDQGYTCLTNPATSRSFCAIW